MMALRCGLSSRREGAVSPSPATSRTALFTLFTFTDSGSPGTTPRATVSRARSRCSDPMKAWRKRIAACLEIFITLWAR